MATKDEFISEVTKLPGVGKATAEKLWDAGYRSVEDLKGVSSDTLVEKGLAKRAADAVVAGVAGEAGGKAEEIQVVEKRAPAAEAKAKVEVEEKAEIVEEPYAPKIKPELTPELKEQLAVRAALKRREPEFKRYHWYYKASLEHNPVWRKPRGTLNKQRRGFAYRPPRVKVGYGKPTATRGLHPSGFAEVFVYNVGDLEKIDPKVQAARIGGTVGGRKRKDIEAKAAELNIRILNPRRT